MLDSSGSLGTSGWNTQVSAYDNIFSNNFHTGFIKPQDELYVSVFSFATHPTLMITETLIDSNATAAAFGTSISNIPYWGGGTDTAAAVNHATGYLLGNTIVGDRMIIDVSTDGFPNDPTQAINSASNANSLGITVNAIGVGPGVDPTFLNNFTTAGGGSFWHTQTFADYESELSKKLFHEIQGPNPVPDPVPEPATFLLLGIGIAGLAGAEVRRRRKKSTAKVS